MYAQKQRLKQSHDDHIKPVQLQKGDLVLVYTLKQDIGNFKKRGFGPCVGEELSASGTIKLYTLDGVVMSNWTSGCRLKKYHLPLTNEMLKRMHAAKNKKEAAALQRQQAQDKAQEQIKKIKKR